ncbi:pyrroloquinoline quinone biosynthesis peptide chaperone PqqD [Streptomyces sp. NPDC056347]|uniref:pyrroloquinoline quinone biosynthesis peptide chaperone PqqD n=1 Tax=Streptomyces sp. NPDC056347 TaxID=3345790 RepID=UPI0035D5AA38
MTSSPNTASPRLRPGVRLTRDHVRDTDMALLPEGVLVLNETAAAVLALCDGRRTVAQITGLLRERYAGVRGDDVTELLADLAERRVVGLDD